MFAARRGYEGGMLATICATSPRPGRGLRWHRNRRWLRRSRARSAFPKLWPAAKVTRAERSKLVPDGPPITSGVLAASKTVRPM